MNKNYNHISLKGLKKGNVGIQFFAAWMDPQKESPSYLEYGLKLIENYHKLLARYKDDFIPILGYEDARQALESDKIGCLLTVEGGEVLEGNIDNLYKLYNLGVRLITLTWNYANEIASGIGHVQGRDGGISRFGKKLISEMNRIGMIIDTSHISYKSFWQVCELSKMPVVASHSNAKRLCTHRRNLDDNQIKAIAKSGGIIGINFYPPFLTEDSHANIDDILRHIDYIAGLVGVDYIGFGSDFDGIDKTPQGIEGAHNFGDIIEGLLKLNYREEQIRKICNENMMRVLKLSL